MSAEIVCLKPFGMRLWAAVYSRYGPKRGQSRLEMNLDLPANYVGREIMWGGSIQATDQRRN